MGIQVGTREMLDKVFGNATPPISAQECPEWLGKLTAGQITSGTFPREHVLTDSFFYPACGEDGGVILFFGRFCQSFIYVDYLAEKEKVASDLGSKFNPGGYDLLGMRELNSLELAPKGVPRSKACAGIKPDEYTRFLKSNGPAPLFAFWAVYERQAGLTLDHGPQRFSIVYVGGEGVATYAALYNGNRLHPRWLGMIQCDGFACNWTEFKNPAAPLHELVFENNSGQPQFIVEGSGGGDPVSPWPEYPERLTTIHRYCTSHNGEVNVFQRI